ncbi:MAG: flavin-dependent oxidoreductase [Ponticaulis sp.]|nr:flavin-dependent oxidoreductase [Ponticaulis sp.]
MRINIIGAGIGGLSAALMLHEAGQDVNVYEGVSELKSLGVGINLLPQAARHLERFGILDDLLKHGIPTRELSFYSLHGQHIWTEPRGLFGGFEAPQVSVGRGVLQMSLYRHVVEKLGAHRVHTGMRLTGFRTEQDQAVGVLTSKDGTTTEISADMMICADGIHSVARSQMYPDEGLPVYAGRVLWRATSFAKPFLSGASMIMAGHQSQKFVCYPIAPVREDGLQEINWIAELEVAEVLDREDWNRPGNRADFEPQFQDWVFDWLDVPDLIRRAEAIYEFPLVDRDPVESWTEGRVTLLGDAAHPMYPIGSNGASQAILDAACLADTMRAGGSVDGILSTYEESRRQPTAAIVLSNRQNGPEVCMQLAHERAPNGFDTLSDVFADGELQEIADRYKQLTGMKRANLSA